MKIAFYSAKPYDEEFFNEANRSFGFEIKYIKERLTKDSVGKARGCQTICAFVNDMIGPDTIDQLCEAGVKLVALRSAGYNNVDLKAAMGEIKVVRVPKYSPYSVAEHAVGMMLCLNRKLHLTHERVGKNNFSIQGLMGFDMHGKTAGVIGCGKIGATVVAILKGFGMKVLGYDVDKAAVEKSGCIFAEVRELYGKCDIITLHCALTPNNFHMIDERAFKQMKQGVMLINTGRGWLIDTKALVEALKSKKVGSAGLDVYEGEAPYFFEDCSSKKMDDEVLASLQSFPNVLITPHQAFFTKEAMENIARITLENCKAFEEGLFLENEVHA